MVSKSSKAIILLRENFGEADQYIQVFAERWGNVSVLAKSARKSKRRYVGGLDMFCHDELFVRGEPGVRCYLEELTVLNSFYGIRGSLDRVMTAGGVVQWVRQLTESSPVIAPIYYLLGETLAWIEQEGDKDRLNALFLLFKLKLLAELGLKPRMEHCVHCQAENRSVIFDTEAGGAVCSVCVQRLYRVSHCEYLSRDEKGVLSDWDSLTLADWSRTPLDKRCLEPLDRRVTQFASFHTHRDLPLHA